MTNIKINTNRSFGLVFSVIFLLITIYVFINNGFLNLYLITISCLMAILGFLNSNLLTPLNKAWFRFGIFLGKIMNPIIMGVIFFFIVTPISVILRLMKKDILNLKYSNKKTYWIIKPESESRMKNQF
jgi:large-conductance mechanosensitive channel